MNELTNVLPVNIEPKLVFGLRSEVIGNIHFNLNQEVIYPVEGVLILHDYVKNKQRFLKLPQGTAPTIITLNSTRLLMAIVEVTTAEDQEQSTNISIYDLLTLKRQRVLQLPATAQHKKITQISFTCESNSLVALTDYPDEMLYMLFFDRLGTIAEGRAGNSNHRGMATCLSCNPQNQGLVAVCGDGVMKLLTKSEKGLTIIDDLKPDFHATSIAWVSPELLFVGTKEGILILFHNSTRKTIFRAKEVEAFDLTAETDLEEQQGLEQMSGLPIKNQAIVCMTAFPKGLAYAIFNQVYVFERVSKMKYERKTILDIPKDRYAENLYQITSLAINVKQDTVIVTPKHNQIYVGVLIVPESLKTKRLLFKTLGELIHIDEIVDICLCAWRPIVVTASKDKTVRVWNYVTERVEMVHSFNREIIVIELYPSGQYAAIGFTDSVKIMQIFMDELNVIKNFEFQDCKDIRFSNLGHLMAVAFENSIIIVSSFNFDTLKTFKGHSGMVLCINWARDDKSIIAGCNDGTLYQWDINTGARLQYITHPGTEYLALCVPRDSKTFFAASDTGFLRQIKDSKVVHELKLPVKSPLLDVSLTRSDLIMFASSKAGHLYNITMPLTIPGGGAFTKTSFFTSAITKIRFSYDGTLLFSSSASGTLVIWSMKNIEGKTVPIDQDLLKSNEVLISRKELEKKNDRINSLEVRLKQQAAEFYKKQSQNEENDQQQMADTHKGYCEALAEMKTKNEEIAVRHAEELVQVTSQIDELNAEHKTQMDYLAAQYSERMLMEYQKFASLRESMLKIRDSYEEKLAQSKACLHDTVEALELDFKNQLEERRELIRQLMKEMEDKKLEFKEYCHQVEIDNDRKMIDCKIEYEKKVKYERDEKRKWKDQAGSFQQKYDIVKKECDNLFEDVTKLKDQHFRSKAQIAELRVDIRDLHRDVADREQAISVKEKRIDEILQKNADLEKYKQVLNHKINELKAQIEPRELQIVEKRKQIAEMEQELSGLQKNNLQLELQLKELKDKCISANAELKIERARAKSARMCITNMCTEIFHVAGNINYPDKLRQGIKYLFHKYSTDDALKKFVTLDTQTQADLHRQRAHIEKIMQGCKQKMSEKTFGKSKRLIADHKILLEEVASCRRQKKIIETELQNMEVLVKIIQKTKPISHTKPKDALVEVERIERYFRDRMRALETEATALLEENEKLHEDLDKRRKLIHKSTMS